MPTLCCTSIGIEFFGDFDPITQEKPKDFWIELVDY